MQNIKEDNLHKKDHIESFRIEQIDATKQKLVVIFSQSKHEQIVSDKISELERLLKEDAINVELIQSVIGRAQMLSKQNIPADFDLSQIPSDPILKQLRAMMLNSCDAPFLRDDYKLLQKIHLHIRHIQDLKSSVQQRLGAGVDIPRYYRTDIVSREWIQDNRDSLQKLMTAFEKAWFSDEIISPPERLDEVSKAEHYKKMRNKLLDGVGDKKNNNNALSIINTGVAQRELKTELQMLFDETERWARHYMTHYYYPDQDDEDYLYREDYRKKYGYEPGEREEIIELAIHIHVGLAELDARQQELQKTYPDKIENFRKQLVQDTDKEYINIMIIEYKIKNLAQRIVAGSNQFSAEDLEIQANHPQELEKKIQDIHQDMQRDKERVIHAKEKQKEFDRDEVSENIYKQLKIIEYYFLNRLDIKTHDGEKITFFSSTQTILSSDGLLYFRDHQEKDINQRFLDRMRGKEQDAPVFLKWLKISDLSYGALEDAIKQLEEKDVAPIFGSLLRYQALPRLEDKNL